MIIGILNPMSSCSSNKTVLNEVDHDAIYETGDETFREHSL